MAFGTASVVINDQRFKISVAGSEVSLTFDGKFKSIRTVDRTNTRAGAVDSVRWVLEEIEFTALLTESLLTEIQTDATISANSAMTFKSWLINGVDISGAAPTSDTYSAMLIEYEELAPEAGLASVRVKLRVLSGAL